MIECICLENRKCHECGKLARITARLHNWCWEHFDKLISAGR